jgi:glutamate formiminotransferase
VAYNVNLATSDLTVAREIAKAVRESSGGLPAVQARGMATTDPDIAQVSMNLLDTSITPLHVVYEAVRDRALQHGVDVATSEVVGLLPLDVLVAGFRRLTGAKEFAAEHVVEARLLETLAARGQEPPD